LNQKGLTLVEILIGLIIFAIGVLGIVSMQIISVKGGGFSNDMDQAGTLAQDKLEDLKNLAYADLNGGSDNPPPIFSRQWSIAEDVGNSMKTITVTVQWTDTTVHRVSLRTIRAK